MRMASHQYGSFCEQLIHNSDFLHRSVWAFSCTVKILFVEKDFSHESHETGFFVLTLIKCPSGLQTNIGG